MKYITLLLIVISFEMYSQTTPGEYTVKNVITNTKFSDFGTSFFGKDKVIFASPKDNTVLTKKTWSGNNQPFLDLYIGTINEKGEIIGKKRVIGDVNGKFHEGVVCFTKDLKTVYFSANNYTDKNKAKKDSTGMVNIQLYKATVEDDGEWTQIIKLSFNNDEYSTGHPTLNRDDTKLYFVSDRYGSVGKTDIYVVDVNADGTYGEPKNLGAKINTEEREMFPFISDDNILYFSSNGHPGYGALDVFASRIFDTTVSEPINLEDPVNSSNDDFAFIINDDKHKGYFSSNNRKDGKGDDDIYSFISFPPLKIEGNQVISGIIIDKETQKLIPGAIVVLLDEQGNELERTIVSVNTDSNLEPSINNLNQKYQENVTAISEEVSDIHVNKTVDNPAPNAGEEVEFTVEVTNKGTGEATEIKVSDILPEGYEYVHDDGSGTYQSDTDILTLPNLAAGEKITLKIKAVTPKNDLNENNQEKITVLTGEKSDVHVNKTVDNSTPNAGEEVEFTVEITNKGTGDATSVKVSDILPEGYEYVNDDGEGKYQSGTDILTVPKLAIGETTTIKIKAITTTNNLNQNNPDIVSVISGDITDIRIDKRIDILNPNTGEEVEFTIEVTNKGTRKSKEIKVSDILPEGYTYVSDDGDGTYLSDADILTLSKLGKGETITIKIKAIVLPSGKDGSFSFEAKSDTKYKIAVIAPGYLKEEIAIKTVNDTDIDPLELNVSLAQELRVVDEKIMININTIYFDFDKWNIRPEAAKELDKVIAVMKDHPSMIIEGGSHTDSRAREAYNQRLSEKRARSTVDYIVSGGVDRSRITSKGYGELQLVNNCSSFVKCSREEHQLNRRTEFVIVNDNDRFVSAAATIDDVVIGNDNMTKVRIEIIQEEQRNLNTSSDKLSYHIIAGAFKNPKNAIKKVNQLKAMGYKARIVGVNRWGLTQVSLDSYVTKKEALYNLSRVRKTKEAKGAWLFVQVVDQTTSDIESQAKNIEDEQQVSVNSGDIKIDPIHFDFDKWSISDLELKQLDKVVQIMKDNPTIVVEAGSHTDSKNLESYNQLLSEKRAQSVVNYIVSKGVSPNRIIGKGYGEMKLTNHCKSFVKCTPEEQQANRRTEFKIIKI